VPVVLEHHSCVKTLCLRLNCWYAEAICSSWIRLCLLHSCALLIRENLLLYLLDVLQPIKICFRKSAHKTGLLLVLVSDAEHFARSRSCSHSGVVASAWVTLVIRIDVAGYRVEGHSCNISVFLVNTLGNGFGTVALGSPGNRQAHTFSNCVLGLTVRTTLIAQRIRFCSSGEAAGSGLSLAFRNIIYNFSRVDNGPAPGLVIID